MVRSVLVLLVVLVVCFGTAEALLRRQAAEDRVRIEATLDTRSLCTKPDEHLIYTYRQGECGMNEQGYPDVARAFAKAAGVFRIVLIGDSVAEGVGVDRRDRFAAQLETMLSDSTDSSVEIVVLARRGYSMSQELHVLENEAHLYDPDLILWSYVLNDPGDPVRHNFNGQLGAYYHRPRSYFLDRVAAGVFRLRESVRSQECPEEVHALIHCVYRDEVADGFRRIAATSMERGIPVHVILHPIFEDAPSYETYGLAGVHADLAGMIGDTGMPWTDLLPAYAEYAPGDLRVPSEGWFDPWHPNVQGHTVAAETLLARLRSVVTSGTR